MKEALFNLMNSLPLGWGIEITKCRTAYGVDVQIKIHNSTGGKNSLRVTEEFLNIAHPEYTIQAIGKTLKTLGLCQLEDNHQKEQ